MHYCGVVAARGLLHLCVLGEERVPEPPIRLRAAFYEPGHPEGVAAALDALEAPVVGISAPLTAPSAGAGLRVCDAELRRRGVAPQRPSAEVVDLLELIGDHGLFHPAAEPPEGPTPEGAYQASSVFETNVEAVFCALQGRRLPAKRHPLGIALRIEELLEDHVVDEGGDLWHRRLEEVEAAGAALVAHRYAVGHAWWIGDPEEGVVVLPGSQPPPTFSAEGVLPPIDRLPLPAAGGVSLGRS